MARTLATPARMRTACRALWGEPDRVRTLAPGVVAYSTPSHGGIIVDPGTFPLDARLRGGLWSAPIRWTNSRTGETVLELVGFEEDCDWAALMHCHPSLLVPAIRKGWLAPGVTLDDVRRYLTADHRAAGIGADR